MPKTNPRGNAGLTADADGYVTLPGLPPIRLVVEGGVVPGELHFVLNVKYNNKEYEFHAVDHAEQS